MPARVPTIYLIAGCNGAGKTTFARDFLPTEVKCLRFLNADEIARGLSPLDPRAGAIKAARLLLNEVHGCIKRKQTFALESTLSGFTYARALEAARRQAYEIELHYLWIATPEQALSRIRRRVRAGGHDVPESDVRRRFGRSLKNLISHYLPLSTRWLIWDNRTLPGIVLASSGNNDINDVRDILGL